MSRGNSKSFNYNPEIVKKTINKEDWYSHVVPLEIPICLLSPYLRHTTQTMVIKEDKNPHLCYDASTMRRSTDIVMNWVTPVVQEAPITFGKVKIQLYINIYNRGSGPKVGAIFFLAGDLIFWSPQNSEKNRQTVNKERLFYWQLNNHPPPWLLFSDWSAAAGHGPIKIWQSSRHVESISTWRDDRHLLFFCHWFLECCSQKNTVRICASQQRRWWKNHHTHSAYP
jgi:hypothetical protein